MTKPEIKPIAPVEVEISFLDLLYALAVNLRLLLGGPLLAACVAMAATFMVTPTFTASTTFVPPQQAIGAVSALRSRSLLEVLVARFDLVKHYDQTTPQAAVNVLAQRARVKLGKDGVITVEVDDKDPQSAADLANAHVEELSKLLSQLAMTEAHQRRLYLGSQLGGIKSKLSAAERALGAVADSSNVPKFSHDSVVQGLSRLQAAITAQEIRIASVRGYVAESTQDFKQAQSDLTAMRIQMVQSESAAFMDSGVAGDAAYISRYRDLKYLESLAELLSLQYEKSQLDESREGGIIDVLDIAVPPDIDSRPRRAQIASLAGLATGLALLLFVFIRQTLRRASKDAVFTQKLLRLRSAWRRSLGLAQKVP